MPCKISPTRSMSGAVEFPSPVRSSIWMRVTKPLRSIGTQRRTIENDLCYYQHKLNGRTSVGEVPTGYVRSLNQLFRQLGALKGVKEEEIRRQVCLFHSGVREALSGAPVAVLKAQQHTWSNENVTRRRGTRAHSSLRFSALGKGLQEDYAKAIELAQDREVIQPRQAKRQAQIEQWKLAANLAAPNSDARKPLLLEICGSLRQLPMDDRRVLLATLQDTLPELPEFFAGWKIARSCKIHVGRKDAAIQSAKISGGRVGHLKNAQTGQTYYYPIAPEERKRFPVAYAPMTAPSESREGSSKRLVGEDKRFVALAAKTPMGFASVKNNSDILPFNTVSVNLAINPRLMVARNAGAEVATLINTRSSLTTDAFQPALVDMDAMHRNQIYLCDIKPQNLAFDGKKVNFIDVDDRVNFTVPGPLSVAYTAQWTTPALINDIQRRRQQAFQTTDQYAMLLSIIAATTDNPDLSSYIMEDRNPNMQGAIPKNTPLRLFIVFNKWITKYIQPQFQAHVRALLFEPATVCLSARLKNELLPGLATMFKS